MWPDSDLQCLPYHEYGCASCSDLVFLACAVKPRQSLQIARPRCSSRSHSYVLSALRHLAVIIWRKCRIKLFGANAICAVKFDAAWRRGVFALTYNFNASILDWKSGAACFRQFYFHYLLKRQLNHTVTQICRIGLTCMDRDGLRYIVSDRTDLIRLA